MIQWPDFMPSPVYDQIRIGAPVGAVLRTDMDAGPAKQRPRFTAAPRPVALVFEPVSEDDLERFDHFVTYQLGGGALGFWMDHPITDTPRRFRFVGGEDAWQIAPVGRDAYRVAVSLELLP